MRRRGFLALLGSSAMAWPLAARAQHQGVRRIGVLYSLAEDDPESTVRRVAFEQALKDLGWTNGSNLRIGYRCAQNDPELIRKFVAELITGAPDVILTSAASSSAQWCEQRKIFRSYSCKLLIRLAQV